MRHDMSERFRAEKHRGMEEFKTPSPRKEVCGEEVCFDRGNEHDDHRPSSTMQRDHELRLERSHNSRERK